jgi:hypothetical protein
MNLLLAGVDLAQSRALDGLKLHVPGVHCRCLSRSASLVTRAVAQ